MSEPHHPRKRFGQHFLKDQQVIEKIIQALHPKSDQNLVEIGPGLGVLTQAVLKEIKHLHAIEIDRDLGTRLSENYPSHQLTLHQQDALRFDFSKLVDDHPSKLRIFGNLPYNISTPILFHLLDYAPFIQDMLFMLQKEVIVRMAATPGHHEYGRLSIMIQYSCEVQYLFDVSPSAFSPPPRVMSSIVKLKPYAEHRPHPLAKDYPTFAKIVNIAFQHRRKTLKNALQEIFSLENFKSVGIDPIRRPETLSVEDFVNLSNSI